MNTPQAVVLPVPSMQTPVLDLSQTGKIFTFILQTTATSRQLFEREFYKNKSIWSHITIQVNQKAGTCNFHFKSSASPVTFHNAPRQTRSTAWPGLLNPGQKRQTVYLGFTKHSNSGNSVRAGGNFRQHLHLSRCGFQWGFNSKEAPSAHRTSETDTPPADLRPFIWDLRAAEQSWLCIRKPLSISSIHQGAGMYFAVFLEHHLHSCSRHSSTTNPEGAACAIQAWSEVAEEEGSANTTHFTTTVSLCYHDELCSRLTSRFMWSFIRVLQEITRSPNRAMTFNYFSGETPLSIKQLKLKVFLSRYKF